MTLRTSPDTESRKEVARLPTPSELDSLRGLQEATDRVLAKKLPKDRLSKDARSKDSRPYQAA
jgi:hypothetical protein